MAEPFLSEIRLMSCNFAPRGWAPCNGQPMPINQNQALFSLLGTSYGGNGQTTFALPNFQGRVPVHTGSRIVGTAGGTFAHTLSVDEMPSHAHAVAASANGGGSQLPQNNVLAGATNVYHAPANLTPMRPGTVTNVGGSQPHHNAQPYAVVMFCIALQGLFPSIN